MSFRQFNVSTGVVSAPAVTPVVPPTVPPTITKALNKTLLEDPPLQARRRTHAR